MRIDYYREGSDDTRWVIPELIHADMYRMATLADALRGREGTILDCGAHIGVFSVLLARHGAEQPIEAFEPEPASYDLLVQNARPFPSIRPVPAAVGTVNGERVLYRGLGTGRWSLTPRAPADGIRVPVVNLYQHIQTLGPIALLKLDLEGYEAEILNNMPLEILRTVHVLVTEEHHLPIDHARVRAAGFTC